MRAALNVVGGIGTVPMLDLGATLSEQKKTLRLCATAACKGERLGTGLCGECTNKLVQQLVAEFGTSIAARIAGPGWYQLRLQRAIEISEAMNLKELLVLELDLVEYFNRTSRLHLVVDQLPDRQEAVPAVSWWKRVAAWGLALLCGLGVIS